MLATKRKPRPLAARASWYSATRRATSAATASANAARSAALAVAYVAAGKVDAFWAHHVSPWDVGAGVVLVREAGGVASHFNAMPYTAEAADLLATNGLLHGSATEIINGPTRAV